MRDFSFYKLIMCTFAAAFGIATAKAGYTTVENKIFCIRFALPLHPLFILDVFLQDERNYEKYSIA